jgi:two-component system, cell cycle sensor histidine kinase and response regulator CckA
MSATASFDIDTVTPDDVGLLLEDADGLVQHCTPCLLRHVGLPEPVEHYHGRPSSALHEAVATAFLDRAAYLDGIAFLRDRGQAVHRELLTTATGHRCERTFVPLRHGDVHTGALWQFGVERSKDDSAADRLALFEAIFEALPGQMAVLSPTGRYEFVTPSAIRDEALRSWIIGRTDREYAEYRGRAASVAEARETSIRRVVERRAVDEYEEELLGADGVTRHFLRHMVPMFGADGTVKRVLGYGLELTQLRQVEQQLRQSQKMDALGRLAGGIAHDFNNLLTVIAGCGEALLLELDEGDDRRELLDPILEASKRAADLTRQLLAFSRRSVQQVTSVDVIEVLDRTVAMLRRLVNETIEIKVHCVSGAHAVPLDASQLQQVLVNLAVNARDAMALGGTLTIEVRPLSLSEPTFGLAVGEYVELQVIDTGHGMTEEVRQQAFDPFFTTKPAGVGTGLGLSTVYGIVTTAKGTIRITSTVGDGTSIRVILPRDRGELVGGAPTTASLPVRGTGTILLVENDALLLNLVRRTLQGLGYVILVAHDGVEALAVAAQYAGPIALLLTDVVMPRMGGGILAQRLKEVRPATRVLFMSGFVDDPALAAEIAQGDEGLLQKPFTLHVLAERVADVLGQP